MKKELSTSFCPRQSLQSDQFEIFYYKDINLNRVSSHDHDHYEIYFFLEGDADYEIGQSTYSLQSGDFLLIPPGFSHRPLFHSPQAPYRRFVVWINKDFYESLCQSASEFSYGFQYVSQNLSFHFRPDFITSHEIQAKLMDLFEETHSSHPFHQINSVMMAASFLMFINQCLYDMQRQISSSYENALYLNLCDYINNHLEEYLSLDHLASFFYVSKYHIAHTFKDNMGISLHQYLLKKRLHACKNGILSGIPVCTVYHQYGFNDYTSFYRAFKKEYAMSPSEYREQHQLNEHYLN